MTRDLTRAQFNARTAKHGIKRDAFGYFLVTPTRYVYALNGGPKRRDQLAYLIREQGRTL